MSLYFSVSEPFQCWQSMVADLCHFVFFFFSFFPCEITIIFVFSQRNNDKTLQNKEINEALISAAKYFAPLFVVF